MLKHTLKSLKTNLLPFLFLISLSCSEGEPGPDGPAGVDGQNGFNALVVVNDEAPGDNCAAGGVKISVGQDANENGTLDSDEIASVSFVCNGADGNDGANGSTLVARTSPEEPGENCENGGTLVEIGADANGNGSLDNGEVQTSFFVCNGQDGADGGSGGENGLTSLIRATPLEDCGPNSTTGVRIEVGLDKNGNGVLESNADPDLDEIESTYEICDGADGTPGDNGMNALIGISTFDGDQNGCSNGGIRIAAGLDINGDGTLQGGEEMNVEFICNGTNGNDGATGATGADGRSVVVTINEDPRDCSNGGIEIVLEYDTNGDGIGDEVIGSYIICNGADGATGADGIGLLIRKSVSDVADCPNGGTLVEIDRDENRNGLFDDGEVDVSFDVCDGADGIPGSDGSDGNSIAISVTAATTCGTAGGWVFTVGIDSDNNGTPDTNLNSYTVCNGDDGIDGSDGNSDGVFEFYYANGFDGYTEMTDGVIVETQPDQTFNDEILRAGVNMEAQHISSLLYFPGIEKMKDAIPDEFYITEAILYVRAFTDKAGNTNDNWLGVKAILPEVPRFDETKATWNSPDGGNLWTNADNGFSEADCYDFSDMHRVPGGFDFDGTIPLLLDRSQVTDWLTPEQNKGLALQLADEGSAYILSIYGSESRVDPYYVPTLYIKAKIGSTSGRNSTLSDQEYKARWNAMSYEEKLAPLKNRD
ncbi:DUF7151 family protein [Ekhidna sp.]|uniref:DUF7151 family protein n=1 Tax=Ekhidna sp. TaxID=2608089 RepID=UPI003B59D28F